VVGVGPFLYTDEVRARFDLVGFDPRGIMRSNALQCFDSPDDWPPPVPVAIRSRARRNGRGSRRSAS
jgi:hypothetical protein